MTSQLEKLNQIPVQNTDAKIAHSSAAAAASAAVG